MFWLYLKLKILLVARHASCLWEIGKSEYNSKLFRSRINNNQYLTSNCESIRNVGIWKVLRECVCSSHELEEIYVCILFSKENIHELYELIS